jgi:hypothetical protein
MWFRRTRRTGKTLANYQQQLEDKLRSFKPEDRQKIRAYLATNSGDITFVRQLLRSVSEIPK